MANGVKALRKIQLFRETTAGTPGAGTTRWRGQGVIADTREQVFVEEDIGYLSGVDRSYVPKLGAAMSLPDTPATFEQLPYLFEMGIAALGTGVADTGAGASGKIYTYTAPTTALNTPATYTVEGGDNNEAERMEYAYAEKITLSGKGGEALMMSADLRGRQVALNAFAGGATLPTVEEILFGKGKLYIDSVGGTAGTTQITATLLEMALNYNSGLVPKFTADGALYYTFVQSVGPVVTLDLTFEHNANAAAAKVDWRAQTPKLIQLKFEGTALTTAGTFTYKTLLLTMAGKWHPFGELNDRDGNDIVVGTFVARYNATAAKFFEAKVVNQVTTLP